jgi:small subunit ribosomal protein S7
MSRRITKKRFPKKDLVSESFLTSLLLNRIMKNGKSRLARRIIYEAFAILDSQSIAKALGILEKAVRNISPRVKLKAKRVGGATYQVPAVLSKFRSVSLGLRWLAFFARKRGGKGMAKKLATEILEASRNLGNTYRKKEEIHKMAQANKAFARFSKKKGTLKKKLILNRKSPFKLSPLPIKKSLSSNRTL